VTHASRSPRVANPSRVRARSACRFVAWAASAAALVGVAGGLAGCAGTPPAIERAGDPEPLPVPSLARAWATHLELKKDQVDRLFVQGDMLFVYTKNGTSYVMSRDSGAIRHVDEVPGGNYRLHPPVVLTNSIVYPTTSTLEVFSLAGGLERTIDLGASIHTDAVGDKTAVYVVLDMPNGTRLRKLDLTKAYPVPEWDLAPWGQAFAGAPAVHTDVAYAADAQGLVYAVSAEDRKAFWNMENAQYGQTFDARAPVVADVKADDAGVYVATLGAGRLYCLNRISGQVKWQYTGSAALETSPVVTADTAYQSDPNRGIVAINKLDDPEIRTPQFNREPGKGVRWERKDLKQILAQDDKHTYALRTDGVIVVLDKKTGETQFTSRRKDLAAYATNTKDGVIYGATKEGRVLAIKAVLTQGQVGEVVWNDEPIGPAAAPALAMGPAVSTASK
jgi:outer membrane protein assembly factor BamB